MVPSRGRCVVCARVCYLLPQLLADVVGVKGEQGLSGAHVQHPLQVRQRQHAVVIDALDAEPRHAVQHVCRGETHVVVIITIIIVTTIIVIIVTVVIFIIKSRAISNCAAFT